MDKFDLVICDMTCPRPYELQTLATQAIGGTEASVIRVAEGLGALGARVAVVQHNLTLPLVGKNAFYLPLKMLDEIDTYNYVSLRGTHHLGRFPRARKYSWHEDDPFSAPHVISSMRDAFIDNNVTVIAASDWHKTALQSLLCDPNKQDNPKITYIYNPVPDNLYVPKNIEIRYDRNKLVWPASPHKGLAYAIELVERAIEVSGNKDFKLHIFNPGYFKGLDTNKPFIVDHGPVNQERLHQHMSEALCVFYPSEFKETFGCAMAEANAVHTPVLCHEIAALAETVSSKKQFVERGNPQLVIDKLVAWWKGDRPKVWGQDKFRTTEVIAQWDKLLRAII